MKILFCVTIFFGLCNAIVSNKDVFKSMSLEDRKSFFGTEDGSIPECDVVEFQRPSRSKRSGYEPIYIISNVSDSFSIANLSVVEDDHLISRNRTGVWIAYHDSTAYQNVRYIPWPEILDVIGDFQFLQNAEEGSALTRFWDSHGNEKIVGILKYNYTVKSLPKEFESVFIEINREHLRQSRSVNSINDQDKKRLFLTICKNAENPQENFRHHTYATNDALPDLNLHRPRRQSTSPTEEPDVVHLKLLIIPDFSVVQHYSSKQDLLVELIAHFNSLDVIFRQLWNPEVHLNIAGIIIPENVKAMPYMSEESYALNETNGEGAIIKARHHFQRDYRRFPSDRWDSVIMLTAYPIYYFDVAERVIVNGLSKSARSCSGAAAIASFTQDMAGISSLAHTLGLLFGVNNDKDKALAGCGARGTMVTRHNYFDKPKWTTCSRTAFQSYFRSTHEICAYSRRVGEVPDAVKSMPGAWISIEGQCDNIFKNSSDVCIDEFPGCSKYGCKRDGDCNWISHPPMRGSLTLHQNRTVACIDETNVFV